MPLILRCWTFSSMRGGTVRKLILLLLSAIPFVAVGMSFAKEADPFLWLEEVEGKNLEYFVKLIKGPYDAKDFIMLKPGQTVTQEMFIG